MPCPVKRMRLALSKLQQAWWLHIWTGPLPDAAGSLRCGPEDVHVCGHLLEQAGCVATLLRFQLVLIDVPVPPAGR